jgi:hypothetical protein
MDGHAMTTADGARQPHRSGLRGARRLARGLGVLGLAITLLSPATSAQDESGSHAGALEDTSESLAVTWQAARPPVLGLRLLVSSNRSLHRLLDEHGEVLAEGSRATCQRALADTLLERHGSGQPNLPLATLGGTQVWADVFWHAGWRIQRHVLSEHHRLLDPGDVRRAWGTGPACRAVFERTRAEGKLPAAAPGHLVILLHGLGRTRDAMTGMGEALTLEGFPVAALGYPSTRATIDEHAARLSGLVDQLDGVERVSFVTHSLGGIVVRALLAEPAPWRERITLGGVVMLAPPSQGSSLARTLDSVVFEALLGPSGQQLAGGTLDALPVPPCRFGIVAAGRGDGEGYNPLLPGDDDGVVSVEEAMLPGAADVMVVRGMHTFVMDDEAVQAATARFLTHGTFAHEAQDEDQLQGG